MWRKHHGLWNAIRLRKQYGFKSHRDLFNTQCDHAQGKLGYLTNDLCIRAFTLFKLRTVKDWNELVRSAGVRFFSRNHSSWSSLEIFARKDSFPVKITSRGHARLKYWAWFPGESRRRLDKFKKNRRQQSYLSDVGYRLIVRQDYMRVLEYEKNLRKAKSVALRQRKREEIREIRGLTNQLKGAIKNVEQNS